MKKTQRNISFTQPRSASLFCRFLPESLAKMGRKLASYPTSARLKPIQGGNQCNKTTQKPLEMGNPTWMLIYWYFFHVCPFQGFFFAWRTPLASLSLNPQANFARVHHWNPSENHQQRTIHIKNGPFDLGNESLCIFQPCWEAMQKPWEWKLD